MDFAHQRGFQKPADGTGQRAGHDDEEQDKAVHRPCFRHLPHADGFIGRRIFFLGHFGIQHDEDDTGDAAQNGRCFRADEVSGHKLHAQRQSAHHGRQDDVGYEVFFRSVGQHQDDERHQEHQEAQLNHHVSGNGMGLLGSYCRTEHFFSQGNHGDADRAEAGGHAVADERYERGEARAEAQTNQDGRRNRHRRAEARHAFQQAAKAPHNQQYLNALVAGNVGKLLFNHFNLLAFQQHVVAEQSHQNHNQDGEDGLQHPFGKRPADVSGTVACGGREAAHVGHGKNGNQNSGQRSQDGTAVAAHFETDHQNNQQ